MRHDARVEDVLLLLQSVPPATAQETPRSVPRLGRPNCKRPYRGTDVSSCPVIDVPALRLLLLTVTSWLDPQEREILAY